MKIINQIHPNKIRFWIITIAGLLFIPFLGGVHLFDWDEINFAEAAREMIVTKNYLNVQINFQPFWEKPPLFIWMQVLSMKMFGINEFAARFPNAICGIVTLSVIFNIGRKIQNNLFGILWVLAYVGSVLPFFYFKSGIIDPWFNLFIFFGIFFLQLYLSSDTAKKTRNIIGAAVFAGLAILTKGPVGLLIIILTSGIFLIVVKFRVNVKISHILLYLLVTLLVGGSWFIVQIFNGHFNTVVDFVIYQVRLFQTKDAGHGGFFGYHFVVLFFTVFPTSILALKSFGKGISENVRHNEMKKWMLILFWVVLILFTIVKTKIVHYSSLAYFPLSFLAADFVWRVYQNKTVWNRWISVLIFSVALIYSAVATALPFFEKIKDKIIAGNLIDDPFTLGQLQNEVQWSQLEALPGLIFILAVVLILTRVKEEKIIRRAVYLWGITLLFTLSLIILFVPKVEKYSQNDLIEFFKSHAGEDVYLKNIYFRSYATWFYGETTPPQNKNYYDENWLLSGDIDKDVYFVTKINRAQPLDENPELIKTGEKNGFVFYVRKKTSGE
jgi:4-amino-4-deoxy-L-arabinose transferase-like glycosyltransferase